MIKRFIIVFVLLVLVCGGIVGFNIFREQAIGSYFASMPRPSLAVSTADVAPMVWKPGIEAIGTVSASRGVDLTVETTGIVKDIGFTANDKVKGGQVLLQLDAAVQRADLEVARTQAALDQTTLDRALELQKRGVGSTVTVDQASAAASTSASQVVKLQAVLDQKQLVAPFGGTIGIPKIDNGQYLAPGTIVATLQDLETMRADFSVPEQQLGLLDIGQPVRLGVNAESMIFVGKVTGIEPKVDPTSRLVLVRASVTNPEGRLSPGQFVQVSVELPEERNVIAVAQTAVTASLYGDFVYVVRPVGAKPAAPAAPESAKPAESAPQTSDAADDGVKAPLPADEPAPVEAEPADQSKTAALPPGDAAKGPALVANQIFVKTGRRSQGLVEILSGVSAGDVVVTAGQNRLSNGSPVTIENSVQPEKVAAR